MSPSAPLGYDSFLRLYLFLTTLTALRSTSWVYHKRPFCWNLIFSHLIEFVGSWEEDHRRCIFMTSSQEYIFSTCAIAVEVVFVRFLCCELPPLRFSSCTPWNGVTTHSPHVRNPGEWGYAPSPCRWSIYIDHLEFCPELSLLSILSYSIIYSC